jgi:hypothetical protein
MLTFIDSIKFFSIYLKIIAYAGSLRETQSQDTQHLSWETIMGDKTQQKRP